MKRVLIKISGELIGNDAESSPFSLSSLQKLADDIRPLLQKGIQVAIVLGGGNILRGASVCKQIDRPRADQVGMLATVMNGLLLHAFFQKAGVASSVYSSTYMPGICEQFSAEHARRDLESGHVVICTGGSGNPYFTTDTAAILRALELNCEAVLKATKVDGVYSGDPHTDANVKKYDAISYDEILTKKLRVMDLTAISMAAEHALKIIVFSLKAPNCFQAALSKGTPKTIIS